MDDATSPERFITDPLEHLFNLGSIGQSRANETAAGLGICGDSRKRLIDLMSDAARHLSHNADTR